MAAELNIHEVGSEWGSMENDPKGQGWTRIQDLDITATELGVRQAG